MNRSSSDTTTSTMSTLSAPQDLSAMSPFSIESEPSETTSDGESVWTWS
jgi:hypothetical protein